jgi:murein tripeptide amidase MpaA
MGSFAVFYLDVHCFAMAGAAPSSFLCEGIIRFLLSENLTAYKLRRRFIFMIIPMMNPDGVVSGVLVISL